MAKKNDISRSVVLAKFAETFSNMRILSPADQIKDYMDNMKLPAIDPKITHLLSGEGLSITGNLSNKDVDMVGKNQIFTYKKRPVIVYIRDQYLERHEIANQNYNKYHVCFCEALKEADRKNKYKNRYVLTTRKDGLFATNVYDKESGYQIDAEDNILRKLKICQRCLEKLDWKGFANLRKQYNAELELYGLHSKFVKNSSLKYKIYRAVDSFDIDEFFSTIRGSVFDESHMPSSYAAVSIKKEYTLTPMQKAKLKKLKHYTCERCNQIFNERELEIHHIDHNQGNNSSKNLSVLCKYCHSDIHASEDSIEGME